MESVAITSSLALGMLMTHNVSCARFIMMRITSHMQLFDNKEQTSK